MGIELIKPAMWCPGIHTGHPFANGLLGHWPLWEGGGEVSMDVSGNGYEATHSIVRPGMSFWIVATSAPG
jgi:hypothetical protein